MMKIESELVSIIVPTYNRADILKETINSVLNQTYNNFELLIIDDGSKDNTREIVKSYKDDRIKYFFFENSGKPAVPRNKGLEIAKGEYIAFLDSDDFWFSKKLEIQINMIKKNPNISIIASNGILFPKKQNPKCYSFQKDMRISFKKLLKCNIIINSSVLMKKNVIDSIGFLDENLNLKGMEDYDYWLRFLRFKDNSILILKDLLIKYRLHREGGILRKLSFYEKYKKWRYIFYKFKDFKQDYLNTQLRYRILENKLKRKDKSVLKERFNIVLFLRDNKIMFSTRLLFLLEFFDNEYLRKNNIFINIIIKIFDFIILKYLKLLKN